MQENNSLFTQLILLGLLPLLAATTNFSIALIIGVSSLIIAFLTRLAYIFLSNRTSKYSLYLLILAIGFALSSFLYQILPALFPALAGYVKMYLLFLGLTPIVYIGCNPNINWKTFIFKFIIFISLMGVVGLIREIPIGFVNSPVGSFIVLGSFTLLLNYFEEKLALLKQIKKERGLSLD